MNKQLHAASHNSHTVTHAPAHAHTGQIHESFIAGCARSGQSQKKHGEKHGAHKSLHTWSTPELGQRRSACEFARNQSTVVAIKEFGNFVSRKRCDTNSLQLHRFVDESAEISSRRVPAPNVYVTRGICQAQSQELFFFIADSLHFDLDREQDSRYRRYGVIV